MGWRHRLDERLEAFEVGVEQPAKLAGERFPCQFEDPARLGTHVVAQPRAIAPSRSTRSSYSSVKRTGPAMAVPGKPKLALEAGHGIRRPYAYPGDPGSHLEAGAGRGLAGRQLSGRDRPLGPPRQVSLEVGQHREHVRGLTVDHNLTGVLDPGCSHRLSIPRRRPSGVSAPPGRRSAANAVRPIALERTRPGSCARRRT